MTFLPIDRVMSSASRAGKLRGVHLAIVTDNAEGADNPGGRVKVKFPWMNADESTFFARIALPMAGNERGTFFLPEVDDQLLVVFEHGEIDKPVIIGAVWNNKQKAPETNESGKNQTKLIKSRS
ncbi:MAG TPA: phage baseplate assembly protein V, partial [Kofleriaceae bacterium]|nr:phage baseplate assembly protein V [Kofleriaceae bacterium]